MRRFARHAFTLLSALSLLLCVETCVLWVKSYAPGGGYSTLGNSSKVPQSTNWVVRADRGEITVAGVTREPAPPDGIGVLVKFPEMVRGPCWLFASILALPAVIHGTSLLRAIRRPMPGHCEACGYDLRAHTAGGPAMSLSNPRCPECGGAITG